MLARILGLGGLLAIAGAACASDGDRDPLADASAAANADASNGTDDPDGAPGDLGIEPVGGLRRFDLVNPMCTVELFDSGEGCPTDDSKCLCLPELAAVNQPKGSAGNPDGRVILLSQPRFGKREDGSYAFDAYAAVKQQGNVVGHYVNELNPSRTCTAAESWTGVGCAGGGGCGWRCLTGAERGDEIVDTVDQVYAGYPSPEAISLNEAWSTIYRDDQVGVIYRQWIRDLTRQMAARGRLPLLYVQERHLAVGPYTYLAETSQHALIMVEAYLSGREVLAAPGQCAPPYGPANWCTQKYAEIRGAIRNSAKPAIPFDRLIMVEHFATNTYRYTDPKGNPAIAGWGRAYDDTPGSPTFGTPSTSAWDLVIERRARAMKALPSLGGVGSYSWAGNGSGTGSSFRVQFGETYSAIPLP